MQDCSLLNFNTDCFLQDSFRRLPINRLRRHCQGKISNQYINWSSKASPNVDINKNEGSVKRESVFIESKILDYVSQYLILPNLSKLPPNNYSIDVHQIRIVTNELQVGKTSSKGLHQDGFDYIIIFCVTAENIIGGNYFLSRLTDKTHSLVDYKLQPGQGILFNDKKYQHSVAPIMPHLPGFGYRDVFVATFKQIYH